MQQAMPGSCQNTDKVIILLQTLFPKMFWKIFKYVMQQEINQGSWLLEWMQFISLADLTITILTIINFNKNDFNSQSQPNRFYKGI